MDIEVRRQIPLASWTESWPPRGLPAGGSDLSARERSCAVCVREPTSNPDGISMPFPPVVNVTPPPRFAISTDGWSLDYLLKQSNNFREIPRVHATSLDLSRRIGRFESSKENEPLVIEGWHETPEWPSDLFTIDWLRQNGKSGEKLNTLQFIPPLNVFQELDVRNVHSRTDKTISLSDFIEISRAVPPFAHSEGRGRPPCFFTSLMTRLLFRIREIVWQRCRMST